MNALVTFLGEQNGRRHHQSKLAERSSAPAAWRRWRTRRQAQRNQLPDRILQTIAKWWP
jgi:hypothetical protein